MNIAGLISRPLYWVFGKVFSIWARPAIQPENPAEYITSSDAAVCYVLETGGLADVLALERACALQGMPSPTEPFEFCGVRESKRFIVMRRMKGFWPRRPSTTGSRRLKRLIEGVDNCEQELLLIPVAIYWGRSPEKEHSVFKLLLSENWDIIGRTRKFFVTIMHGRNTLLRFSHALPIRTMCEGGCEPKIAFRKASRILRVHFRKRRTATVGPDLSHRRTLVKQVLHAPEVRRVIKAEAGEDYRKQEVARRKAEKYALEIAADFSYPTIRILVRLLRWLWNRIYDGVEVNHMQRLHDVANEKEVIYVPCHRSHIDYLLLGYDIREAYVRTIRSAGRAVTFTGLTLSAGVITWIFSPLKFQGDMGILLTFIFLWNMIGALTLLPALAVFMFKTPVAVEEEAVTGQAVVKIAA